MAKRHQTRAIELLDADQANLIRRPADRPRADLRAGPPRTPDMGRLHKCRHGSTAPSDMDALAEYMRGLVDGGPTKNRAPARPPIVEAPGQRRSNGPNVALNAWTVPQILAPRVHGLLARRVGRRGEGRAGRACRTSASQSRSRQDRPRKSGQRLRRRPAGTGSGD